MAIRRKGTVVWYRPPIGRGVVRAADGRQFFFDASEAQGLDLEPGVRLEFALSSDDRPTEAQELAYQDGTRTLDIAARPAPKGRQTTRKQRQAARRSKAEPATPRRPPGAMAEGTSVNHPEHGAGHVVAATANLVSVEFLSGRRKSFSPSALQDLSGPDVPKAPRRRKRAPKKTEPQPNGGRTVRRKKSS